MLGLTSYRLCTTVHLVVCRFMQFSAAAVKFLGSRFKAIGRLLGVCARCALLGAKINSSLACVVFTLFRIQFSAIWSWWLRYNHCILFFTHKVYSGVSKVWASISQSNKLIPGFGISFIQGNVFAHNRNIYVSLSQAFSVFDWCLIFAEIVLADDWYFLTVLWYIWCVRDSQRCSIHQSTRHHPVPYFVELNHPVRSQWRV